LPAAIYFLSGTFDVLGLASIAAGTLGTFLILALSSGEEPKYAPDIQNH
jgi:hypothetical protein